MTASSVKCWMIVLRAHVNVIFSGSSHTCDLKIGIPGATLPGAWPSRVSTGTSWPGVSML